MRVWKALRVDDSFEPARMDAYDAEAFLLDAPSERLRRDGPHLRLVQGRRAPGRKIILAGGLDADNVRAAIRLVRPWGVDACSRLEIAPGRKDHARMARFLKAALSENHGMTSEPDTGGHFGPYGGRYVPEMLMAPLEELEHAYLPRRARIRRSRASWTTCCATTPDGPRRCTSPGA